MLSGVAPPVRSIAAARSTSAAFALLVFLLLALQFGPMVGLLGFGFNENPLWTLNGAARDFTVAALVVLAGAALLTSAGSALPASVRWALLMVAVYAALALLSSPGLFVLALNLRRLVLVPLLFAAVVIIPWTPRQFDRLFGVIVGTSVVVMLFGLVEWFAPTVLWTDVLQIEAFSAASGFDRFGLQAFQNNGRFFSHDLEPWTGTVSRRMVSTYLEPTTLAAGLSVALVIGLARRARGHGSALLWLLAAACGVMTMSKGFWMFLAVLLAWRCFGIPTPRQIPAMTALLVVVAMALTGSGLESGPFAHLVGVQTSIRYLLDGNLLGEGIGLAGNYTNADTDVGTESGLGNAIAQTGVAAVLPLLWLGAIGRDVLRRAAASRDPGGPWVASWTLFWLVTYVFSASSQGVGGNALGFVMLALYLNPAAHGTGRSAA